MFPELGAAMINTVWMHLLLSLQLEEATNKVIRRGRNVLNDGADKLENLTNTVASKVKSVKPEDLRNSAKNVAKHAENAVAPPKGEKWKHNLRITTYFALWYRYELLPKFASVRKITLHNSVLRSAVVDARS
jgi:hypothetical protein